MRKPLLLALGILLIGPACTEHESRAHEQKVASKDGTTITFERTGAGPAVILVDGALCYRDFGPSRPLAALLKNDFTVYTYDRRGRGGSGDKLPYSVEREIEDLDAILKRAGGSAYVYGISSGAVLSLEAASRLAGIKKIALYEPPFITHDNRSPLPDNYLEELNALIEANQLDDAVRLFMNAVGVPHIVVWFMQWTPSWRKLKAVAHTLPYDAMIMKDSQGGNHLAKGRWNSIKIPMIFLVGSESPTWMEDSNTAAASAFPQAQRRTLKDQDHDVKPQVLAPVLIEFFKK